MVSCPMRKEVKPIPAPTKQHFPNVLDTMPQIAISAMDELEQMVKEEVAQKALEFAKK